MVMAGLEGLEAFLPEVLDKASMAFVAFDERDRVLACNRTFLDLFGYGEGELDEMRWPSGFVPVGRQEQTVAIIRKLGCGEPGNRFESVMVRKDGSPVPVEIFVHRMCDLPGNTMFYYSFIADISGRRRAEEALQSSEEKYRAVFDTASDGITIQDAGTWEIVDVNRAMCDMYGYLKDEFMHIQPGFLFSDDETLALQKAHEKLEEAAAGRPQLFDWHARHRDGHEFWVQVSLKRMRAGGQDLVLSIVRDVTGRKRMEKELEESEDTLAQAQQLAHLGSWRWDIQLDILKMSDEGYRIMGLNPGEVRLNYETFLNFIHPDDREAMRTAIVASLQNGDMYRQTHRLLRRDGSVRWIQCKGKTLSTGGRPEIMFGTMHDITERKVIEDRLRQRDLEVTTLLDSLDAFAFLKDATGVYVMVNQRMCEAVGMTREEIVGKTDYQLYPRDLADRYRAQDRAVIESGEPILIPEDETLDRGRYIKIATRKVPLGNGKGHVIGVIGVGFDITEIKRAEQEVDEARAQAELFLDLMGHDINNMNQVALGYLEMALDKLRAGEQIGTTDAILVEKPLETLESSSNLIQNVKKLQQAKSGGMAIRTIDLSEVLAQVREQAIHAPGRAITIDYRPARGLVVMANELIQDLFSNIATNAVKHSDPARPLHIHITVDRIFEAGQEYYKVSIDDNGPGITDAVKRQIFGRLQHGRGRPGAGGIGLYLVSTLVNLFSGRIWVEDRVPGDYTQGSRFVVMLPAIRAENTRAGDEARA